MVGADLPEGAVTDTPPSSFGSPPYFPQTQPAGIEPSLTERSEFYQTSFRPKTFTAGSGAAAVTGSSINIPRVEQRDTGMYADFINKPSGLSTGFPAHSGRVGADSSHDDLHDASVDEGSSEILDAQLGQIGTTPVNDNYMAAATRQLSENLILQENNNGVVQHMRSGVNVSAGGWPNGAQVVANGATGNLTTTTTSTKSSVLSPEFDPAFVLDDQNRNHVMLSDSPVDGNPPHRDASVMAEDAESSEDTEGSRSKSEENEIHAEQGDVDVWEGSMFPFCEEGA